MRRARAFQELHPSSNESFCPEFWTSHRMFFDLRHVGQAMWNSSSWIFLSLSGCSHEHLASESGLPAGSAANILLLAKRTRLEKRTSGMGKAGRYVGPFNPKHPQDPCIAVRGDKAHRDSLTSLPLVLWFCLGLPLAWKKGTRCFIADWIGANLTVGNNGVARGVQWPLMPTFSSPYLS